MNFNDVLKAVNKAFKIRKPVDFDEFDLHMVLEILDTTEELKVFESLKDLESTEYIEGLKRHTLAFAIKKLNDIDLETDDITYEEDGEKVTKSKFAFMREFLTKWPSTLIDAVFAAYTNMQLESEKRLSTAMKFEKFQMEEPPKVEEKKPEFRPVEEADQDENMTDAEKLSKQVEKEQAKVEEAMAQRQNSAEARVG